MIRQEQLLPFHHTLHSFIIFFLKKNVLEAEIFFTIHRQDNLIIFSTDKNTMKDLAPLVAKANRGRAEERKIKEIW